jgi:hypothetical protein
MTVLAKTETPLENFRDAFDNLVEVGDEVIYCLGDRHSKALYKGTVVGIGHNEERYYGKTRYYIRNNRNGDISPMEHTKRIAKLG